MNGKKNVIKNKNNEERFRDNLVPMQLTLQ